MPTRYACQRCFDVGLLMAGELVVQCECAQQRARERMEELRRNVRAAHQERRQRRSREPQVIYMTKPVPGWQLWMCLALGALFGAWIIAVICLSGDGW